MRRFSYENHPTAFVNPVIQFWDISYWNTSRRSGHLCHTFQAENGIHVYQVTGIDMMHTMILLRLKWITVSTRLTFDTMSYRTRRVEHRCVKQNLP
jgi:hypothetical protein